jgi:hypothetical protein
MINFGGMRRLWCCSVFCPRENLHDVREVSLLELRSVERTYFKEILLQGTSGQLILDW